MKWIKWKEKLSFFLHNCCACKVNVRLENVSLWFLPPNTTANGQAITSLFNRTYTKKSVVKKIIVCIGDTSRLSDSSSTSKSMVSISILTAVHLMNKSWNNNLKQ